MKSNKLPIETKKLINQAELARRLGTSRAYICMVLSGKRKSPKMQEAILEILRNSINGHTRKCA